MAKAPAIWSIGGQLRAADQQRHYHAGTGLEITPGQADLLAPEDVLTVTTFTLLNKANHNGTDRTVTATIPQGVLVLASRYYVDSANNQGVLQYSNPATHINLTTQLSFDGGQSWQDDAGFTSDGGYVNRLGQRQDPEIATTYDNGLPGGTMVVVNIETIGTVRYGLKVDVTTQ